ncbi:MAG: hypothetical protein NTX55_00465 [Candidatus Parcubacteria bacterium]|nr:hypothetical protein [Candidatus Parcubacteria bacterium]
MDDIDKKRHSLAHLLAMAVLEKFPKAKLGIGPTIENGFYYDFNFGNSKSEARNPKQIQNSKNEIPKLDLSELERRMKELIKQDLKFQKKNITPAEAKKIFKTQPYKLEKHNPINWN